MVLAEMYLLYHLSPAPLDYIERNTFRSKPCSNFDSGEISLAVERVCSWPIGSFLPKKADIRIHTLLYSIYRTFEINVKIIKCNTLLGPFIKSTVQCTYCMYTIKTTELVRNLALDIKEFSCIALAGGLNVLLSIHVPLRESMRWAGHSLQVFQVCTFVVRRMYALYCMIPSVCNMRKRNKQAQDFFLLPNLLLHPPPLHQSLSSLCVAGTGCLSKLREGRGGATKNDNSKKP